MKERFLKLQTPDIINNIEFIILPAKAYKDYKIHAGIECKNVTADEIKHQKELKLHYDRFTEEVFELASINTLKSKIDNYCDVCFGNIPVSGEESYKTFNLQKVVKALEKSVLLTNITELETKHLSLYSQALTPLYEFTNFQNVGDLYYYFLNEIDTKFKTLLPAYFEKEKANIWATCLTQNVSNHPIVNHEDLYSYIEEPEYVIFNGQRIKDDRKAPHDALIYGSSLLRQVLLYNNLKRVDSGSYYSLTLNNLNSSKSPFCSMLKVHYEAVKSELFDPYFNQKEIGPETLTVTKDNQNLIEIINGLYDKNNVELQNLDTLFEIATTI